MGRTKALIEVEGIAMAARVADALLGAGCSSVLLFGGDPDELAPLGFPVLPDRYPSEGPLGGVIGVLQALDGDADVLIVACDLPALRAADLAPLVTAAADRADADVIVATTTHAEPTCAIWRASTLALLQRRFDAGERAIHGVFADLDVVEVPVDARALRNINTPEDLGRYP